MKTWELFAYIFGRYYKLFVVVVGHTSFLLLCLSAAWTSPVLTKLSDTQDNPLGRPITYEESDRIGSVFYIGAALGPLLFMGIIDKFGRKKILVIISMIIPITYFILIFAKSVEIYYACRIVQGVYAGVALSVEPVYINEILAEHDRDFLMSLVTIFSFTGILIATALGPFLPLIYFNGFITIFSLIIALLLGFGCPETPVYLINAGQNSRARQVLEKLRKSDINSELCEIENTVKNNANTSNFEIFKRLENFKLLVVATIPLLLQQFAGMTLIVTYSQLIFEETAISIPSHYCSIIVSSLQVSTTFLTPLFLKSKRISIPSLLLICLSGVAVCNLSISFYFIFGKGIPNLNWLPLIGLVVFVIVYNFGLDPIPWMLIGEVYPININSVGTSLSTSIFLLSVFPILYSFRKVDIGYLFLGSGISCILGILYVKYVFNSIMERKKACNIP